MIPKRGIVSFGLGLLAFMYYFIGPKHVGRYEVPVWIYIVGWLCWAAALVSVLLGVESLIREKGKSVIWTIAGLILGGLALLILLTWLSCAELPPPV
ncbi:hypothetical protein GF359_08455 [candidate division WOR-3 bacterium]|uniref:Uncharacterized protein n=1 Tax=candidate division WOR-3 bacterium TaxID=2052148 RepID=A0A9D5QDN3_UNCW3|nr:hypothetical protein [candidate division WOR-3 bacterium]MBD3365231.1 hypothetical protein [candidate division WOR-3 bacterium]